MGHYIHPHVISYFKQSGEYFNELDKTEPSKSDVSGEPTITGK
ncbi:hypothetical protein [Yersinia phage fHe-Yen9-03]|uniref:Uncharacterized protein n=1 Tax=Yersinia phage fHe-Yen9-03 TaxID=2052743 RepID=A0A2C9CZP6_9CAUD|nr:hypothetical protein [Yersinia phage fHe-Yen9-03]